jgi:hypothetical protein
MTVGVGLLVPGAGCVFACDSRTACTSTGHIYTDEDQKWAVLGALITVCAGAPGGLWLDLRAKPPRSMESLRRRVTDRDATDNERGYELLVYDQRTEWLAHLDDSGEATSIGRHGAVGCGGPIALGVLDAARAPQTLEAAARLVRRAALIACRRNAFCGGRVHTVIVPRRGAVVVR